MSTIWKCNLCGATNDTTSRFCGGCIERTGPRPQRESVPKRRRGYSDPATCQPNGLYRSREDCTTIPSAGIASPLEIESATVALWHSINHAIPLDCLEGFIDGDALLGYLYSMGGKRSYNVKQRNALRHLSAEEGGENVLPLAVVQSRIAEYSEVYAIGVSPFDVESREGKDTPAQQGDYTPPTLGENGAIGEPSASRAKQPVNYRAVCNDALHALPSGWVTLADWREGLPETLYDESEGGVTIGRQFASNRGEGGEDRGNRTLRTIAPKQTGAQLWARGAYPHDTEAAQIAAEDILSQLASGAITLEQAKRMLG